jgi:hypothetical protein
MSAEREIEELRATVKNQAELIHELQLRVLGLGTIMAAWAANFPLPPKSYRQIQQGVRSAKKMNDKEKEEVLEHVRLILYQESPTG